MEVGALSKMGVAERPPRHPTLSPGGGEGFGGKLFAI